MDTADGYDPQVWARLAGELGLTGLALPERYGGAGGGFTELGIVLEEAGRALLCAPLLSTVVLAASPLLGLGDDTACADYLPGIAEGSTIATLALTEPSPDEDAAAVTATHGPDGWILSGTAPYVLDGQTATLLLVPARTQAGISVFAVDGAASGLRREPRATLDQTRRLADLTFTGTPARLLGDEGRAGPALARTLDLAAAALAAEQAGGAARATEMAVDYAKTRVQFGRTIGSFQAIKHKLADLHLDVESARSAAWNALRVADEDPSGLAEAASLAKACCGDAFVRVTGENIQVHGGIGVTWEHPAHLYFKRAQASQQLFGNAAYHRQRLVGLVLATLPA
jgi:alkylation response protein AidB-like acyl-CoA dehydrogenase